jgi:hypothetical protein
VAYASSKGAGEAGRGMFKWLSTSFAAEWVSAAMVFLVAALAGRYASMGMNPLQWIGAITAVLAFVTVAVAVRVWPTDGATQEED